MATNAINTAKIAAGHVRNADLGTGAVDGAKVADSSLTGADVANDSLDSSKVTGLNGFDVQDDSLAGADVAEGTLAELPVATVAGKGRGTWIEGSPWCDPGGVAFVTCASFSDSLPAHGRVLLEGYGSGLDVSLSGSGTSVSGLCRLGLISGGTLEYYGEVEVRASYDDYFVGGEFDLTAVTPPVGPGVVTFSVACNETSSDIEYRGIGVSAVQIGAG